MSCSRGCGCTAAADISSIAIREIWAAGPLNGEGGFVSTRTYLGGRLRPVTYGDFQCNERANWQIGRSIMAGVQLLAEYYAGPSPDGQFYPRRVS